MYSDASIKTPTKKASTQLCIVENDGILMNEFHFNILENGHTWMKYMHEPQNSLQLPLGTIL